MNTHADTLYFTAQADGLWGDTIGLFAIKKIFSPERTQRFIGAPIQFIEVKSDPFVYDPDNAPKPTLSLRKDQAQQLIDELWRMGLRPAEGAGSAGQLAAVERHLADMRLLAMTPQLDSNAERQAPPRGNFNTGL